MNNWMNTFVNFCHRLFIPIVILFWSCDSRTPNYFFEKVNEIKIKTIGEKVICEISDLTMDDSGNFYVVDGKCHLLYVINEEGEIIRQIGQQGRGPGELLSPVAVTFLEDKLAILDGGNRRVCFFQKNGEFLSSVHIQGAYLSGVAFNGADTMIVSESLGIENFCLYDLAGKRLSPPRPPKMAPVTLPVRLQGGHMSLTSKGSILFSSIREYHVIEINWQGDTLRTFRAQPEGYIPPDLSSREKFLKEPNWAIVGKPLQLNDMILVQWAKRHSETDNFRDTTWKRFVDLFTLEGNEIKSAVPAPYHFLFVNNDLLYAIDFFSPTSESSIPVILSYRLLKK